MPLRLSVIAPRKASPTMESAAATRALISHGRRRNTARVAMPITRPMLASARMLNSTKGAGLARLCSTTSPNASATTRSRRRRTLRIRCHGSAVRTPSVLIVPTLFIGGVSSPQMHSATSRRWGFLQSHLILDTHPPTSGAALCRGMLRVFKVPEMQRVRQVAGQFIELVLHAVLRLDDVKCRYSHTRQRAMKECLFSSDDVRQGGLSQHTAGRAVTRLKSN